MSAFCSRNISCSSTRASEEGKTSSEKYIPIPQETTTCTSKRRAYEEITNSKSKLALGVKKRQVDSETWIQDLY